MEIECQKRYDTNGNIYSKEYYKEGKIHRDNLPAIICYNENGKIFNEKYYKEGKLHREDGPAKIFYHLNGKIKFKEYWLNGEFYEDKDITDNWEAFCKMQIFR